MFYRASALFWRMGVKTRGEGREGHLRFDAAFPSGASICPFVPREIEPLPGDPRGLGIVGFGRGGSALYPLTPGNGGCLSDVEAFRLRGQSNHEHESIQSTRPVNPHWSMAKRLTPEFTSAFGGQPIMAQTCRWLDPVANDPEQTSRNVCRDRAVRAEDRSRIELCARSGSRNLELLLIHVCRHIGEKRRAQITLAGVRQHTENVRSFLCLGRNLERARKGPA